MLKYIKDWFFERLTVQRFVRHYKEFKYIWVILLAFAWGLFLLCPTINWKYGRFGFLALVAFILWGPLNVFSRLIKVLFDNICCQMKKSGGFKFFVLLIIQILIISMALFILIALILMACRILAISSPGWLFNQWWGRIILLGLTALIIFSPMNAVYGLMGTSGSIRLFFFNFIIISLIFSSIYYFGFFKTAGITYDVNQPHIDFMKYADTTEVDSTKMDSRIIVMSIKRDTICVEHQLDSLSYTETIIQTHVIRDTIMPPIPLHYQPIDFWQVLRSTILTTLTQESADLLSIATVHNEAMESTDLKMDKMNKEKSELFEWILIFHIIISWIFFGVFISLLYNKFRYES